MNFDKSFCSIFYMLMRFPFNIFANLSNEGATQAKNCKDVMMKWKNIFCDYCIYFCNSTDRNKLGIFNFLEIVMGISREFRQSLEESAPVTFVFSFFKYEILIFYLIFYILFCACLCVCCMHVFIW